MPNKNRNDIIDQLSRSISADVGNLHSDNLDSISDQFDDTIAKALKSFHSSSFDNDGFIKRMGDLSIDGQSGDVVKNVLKSVSSDYVNMEALNQNEILLRRDINNIRAQMPEMRDVIYLTRDNIIEANTATGEVSRTLQFLNVKNPEKYISQVEELEERFELLPALKNFIIIDALTDGEEYAHVLPFAKLFAELEVMNHKRVSGKQDINNATVFHESIPNTVKANFHETKTLLSDDNISYMMESVTPSAKMVSSDDFKIGTSDHKKSDSSMMRDEISGLLNSIEVNTGCSELMAEYGEHGFRELVYTEYMRQKSKYGPKTERERFKDYMESYMQESVNSDNLFNKIDQDNINSKPYEKIKGCYLKYMDGLKMIPIRLGRRVIGYYYATTTMDLQGNPAHPNGIVDLSFQHYTRDKNMVEKLASMIIKSFDRRMLEKNIQLKNEIVDIIMAHKFSEGRLSFIYIPEDEIVRFTIDEDKDGKGHSMLEPSIFSARNYMMLNMYNMLYTLNNNTTRIHYLKSSGLNKNYAAFIQRAMRKFQSRRITIDDIYSYAGVLNKVGGMGEIVLPAGRGGDYKALETDTIEAVRNPIDIELIEQQRRQALSGTGAPNLLIINAIDEVDFAKTVELANARYQSRCSALKLDLNKGATKLYQKIMKACTDIEDDVIQAFRFSFNASKQQDLNITSDMITNFNNMVELTMAIYGVKSDWEDEKGNPTHKQKNLRKMLAKKYLPQLDYDDLDDIMNEVELMSIDDILRDKVSEVSITDEDLKEVKS